MLESLGQTHDEEVGWLYRHIYVLGTLFRFDSFNLKISRSKKHVPLTMLCLMEKNFDIGIDAKKILWETHTDIIVVEIFDRGGFTIFDSGLVGFAVVCRQRADAGDTDRNIFE